MYQSHHQPVTTPSPVPEESASSSTIWSQHSTQTAQRRPYFHDNTTAAELSAKKVEVRQLGEDLKVVQMFRPGAGRGDPSYRRIALSAVEYMKDIQGQMIDEIKHQSDYATEPPDTDAEQTNTRDGLKRPSPRYIDAHFLDLGVPVLGESATTSPTDSAEPNEIEIDTYDRLIHIAFAAHNHRPAIKKLKNLDLEPLFEGMRQPGTKPGFFAQLQQVMVFLRKLEPQPAAATPSTDRRFSWTPHGTFLDESRISSSEHSDQQRGRWNLWAENMIWFIHTANTIMGTFHGTLPYYWLNPAMLDRKRSSVKKLPRVPTLEEFDRSRYSISAFPRIKRGIKVINKEVSVQTLSLTDFRYRVEDVDEADPHIIWDYYRDSMLKLSKLIPNKRSFDVAIDVGMIPEDMRTIVDFTWWTNNIIKFGREVERVSVDGTGIDIGKETYELFDDLHKGYYSFTKTVSRDTGEQLKYNPVQFILNIVMVLLAFASLIFAATGIIQVLQGFCVWEEFC
ncbi:hypothetical protein BJV82DRAFT_592546 [Fennellomyces sp. T-0311]|nr:hypothetical protein BJV82DRAFT_592546 [Fennellomyces sp. T-0311]